MAKANRTAAATVVATEKLYTILYQSYKQSQWPYLHMKKKKTNLTSKHSNQTKNRKKKQLIQTLNLFALKTIEWNGME